jgi:hypothetical protein
MKLPCIKTYVNEKVPYKNATFNEVIVCLKLKQHGNHANKILVL